MKIDRKVLKLTRILSYIVLSLIIIPYGLLNLTDCWMVRLIAVFLLWSFLSTLALFLAFAPVKYWLSPRNFWKPPKFMHISRVLFLGLGFYGLIYLIAPYAKGISLLAMNGGELEKVAGVIKRVDAVFPLSIYAVDFKIEGRDEEISLFYYPIGIARQYQVGTRAEFYLLPGTDYAMDVRPAPTDK